jgi:hypothetical protein
MNSKRKLKKVNYLAWSILIGLFVLGLHFFGKYRLESGTPPFILSKLNELTGNAGLMDSLGGRAHFEFSYNKNDFQFGDTVNYSIKIKGTRRTLNYQGSHLRTGPDQWKLKNEKIEIRD